MAQTVLRDEASVNESVLYVAFELSSASWKLAIGDGKRKPSVFTVVAGDLRGVDDKIALCRDRFDLSDAARIVSCYEAGRDGFWLHRELLRRGIENVVVDSSSIEVNRRMRHVKTDRLDSHRLLMLLVRSRHEPEVWSELRVPSPEEEDRRRLHREIERLKKERGAHRVRIISLFKLFGVDFTPTAKRLAALEQIALPTGGPLPPLLRAELLRERERLELVNRQLKQLITERQECLEHPKSPSEAKAQQLMTLRGVGEDGAWICTHELFGWRRFSNRRQVAGAVGLTPTPYQSGDGHREQGISKSGNRRVRKLLIQMAWGWLRHQPNSALTQWFEQRFAHGKGRMRRVGIVALARKLLVALWRFVEDGVVPEGALLKAA